MEFSSRMDNFGSAIFSLMKEKKDEKISKGVKVIDLSVGSPDMPPAPHIIDELKKEISNLDNYVYAINDLPELKDAVAKWYNRRFSVKLDPDKQITSLIGSQDGLAHLPLTLVDDGDTVLVPDPGYPIFSVGPLLAGANLEYMPLEKEKNFLIDFETIDPKMAKKAKLIIVSYPGNPIPVVAPKEFYTELIRFAKEYDIVVVHDNAYSELTYDGSKTMSFLNYDGAIEVGVEFNSLSKTYNMAGCRVGFALGNEQIISKLQVIKSNIDYGVFLPLQKAAIAALQGPQDCVKETVEIYKKRRDILVDGLNSIGWEIEKPNATMFVWAPILKEYKDSFDFAMDLLDKTGVVVTPGIGFGRKGKKFIRIALVQSEDMMKEVVERIKDCNIIKK